MHCTGGEHDHRRLRRRRAGPSRNPPSQAARHRPGPVAGVVPQPPGLPGPDRVRRAGHADGLRHWPTRPAARTSPCGSTRTGPARPPGSTTSPSACRTRPPSTGSPGRLDELGQAHAGVHRASMGWILPEVLDPDGHTLRFYTMEHHTDMTPGEVTTIHDPRETAERLEREEAARGSPEAIVTPGQAAAEPLAFPRWPRARADQEVPQRQGGPGQGRAGRRRPRVHRPVDAARPAGLRIGRPDRAGRHVRARRVHADHPGDLVELEPGRPALRQRIRPAPDRPLIIPNGPGACPAAAPSSPGPEECAASRGWDRSWMIRP